MTDHQKRILLDMLNKIDAFSSKKINLINLVSSLEGLLDASEFKDKTFIKNWYDKFIPLEEISAHYAGTIKDIPLSEISNDIDNFKNFLQTCLREK